MSRPLDDLDAVIERLDTTVCVVTSIWEGRPAGCLVTYLTPASLQPRRLLVLTSHENLTHQVVERSGVLAVNLVPRHKLEWHHHFGYRSGREIDKFAALDWRPGATGAPLLGESLGWVEGNVVASLDCGDHTARLVEPVAARLLMADTPPLTMLDLFALGLERASSDQPPPA